MKWLTVLADAGWRQTQGKFLNMVKRCWIFLDPSQWELLPFQRMLWKQFLLTVPFALLLPNGLASDPTSEALDTTLDMPWVHDSG